MTAYQQLLARCRGKTVYVQTHNFPDPDALASGFGLCAWFEQQGFSPVLCYDGQLDKRACKKMVEQFHIQAAPVSQLPELTENDFLICVDTQKKAGNITLLPHEIDACIDHHPTFYPAFYQYEDLRKTGSCASIVADYFDKAGLTPSGNVASALLYGIKIDTRNFTRGVTELDIQMFQFLNRVCDGDSLRRVSSNTLSFTDLKAYSSAIESLQVYGLVGFAEIDFPCSDDLIAMISDFFLSLAEIELSVVFSRREDGIKISIRSESEAVHAGNWASRALAGYGTGGGHPYMAGGVIPPENISLLGQYPDETIRNLFLQALPAVGGGAFAR